MGTDIIMHYGWEPWSSGYGRWLIFWRPCVWNQAPYSGWTFLHYFVVKCVMSIWKRRKRKEKEGGYIMTLYHLSYCAHSFLVQRWLAQREDDSAPLCCSVVLASGNRGREKARKKVRDKSCERSFGCWKAPLGMNGKVHKSHHWQRQQQ